MCADWIKRLALAAIMLSVVVLLTSPAAAGGDPFAAASASSASAPAGSAAPAAVASDAAGKCDHITSALCGKQNSAMIGVDAGYVVVSVLIVALLRAWLNKRGSGGGALRFFLPMFLGAGAAGTLAGLDPARGADLACCLANGTFRAEILLQDSTVGRALLFGALPAAVLFTLVVVIIGAVRR
jgi:hypothetical protein